MDMVILSKADMFDVKISTLLADYDRETLTNLYQPIIGYTALAVYFTFWSEGKNQEIISLSSHEQILLRMRIATGEFIEARKVLEAVGLLKTRLEKVREFSIYHYELFAPKTPIKFFNDTLLYGLLIQNIGENEASRIKRIYQTKKTENQGEDISSSFNDVFHPNFEDAAFLQATNKVSDTIGRRKSKIDTEFSYEKFFDTLSSISQLTDKSFTKNEIKEIERLATLYGMTAEIAAEKVVNCFSLEKSRGQRVDFVQLNEDMKNGINFGSRTRKGRNSKKNLVVGEEGLAAKVKYFESANPKDVLSVLQNGTKPAAADLNIVRILASDYKLTNAVINVIIDFVLQMNNNVLSKYSVEKIASSISREDITTAVDAMEYLNNNYTGKKEKSVKVKTESKKIEEKKNINSESVNLSEERQAELLEWLKDQ